MKHIPVIDRILIVATDKTDSECTDLKKTLMHHEYDVELTDCPDAVADAHRTNPDLVILDCYSRDEKELILNRFMEDPDLEDLPCIILCEYHEGTCLISKNTIPNMIGTIPAPVNLKRLIESMIIIWTAHHLVHEPRKSIWSKLFT